MRRLASLLLLLFVLWPQTGAAVEPPRPLSERSVANLTAFARLLALVRFFHPSDAAAAADWNRVAVAGGGAGEGGEDSRARAGALEDSFRPRAPSLRVSAQGKPEVPAELLRPAGAGPFKVVAWRHFGGHFGSPSKVFSSE